MITLEKITNIGRAVYWNSIGAVALIIIISLILSIAELWTKVVDVNGMNLTTINYTQPIPKNTTAIVFSADDNTAHWAYFDGKHWNINGFHRKQHVTKWVKPEYLVD